MVTSIVEANSLIFFGSHDSSIRIFSATTLSQIILLNVSSNVNSIAVIPSGLLVSGLNSGEVLIHDLNNNYLLLNTFKINSAPIKKCEYLQGNLIGTSISGLGITIWGKYNF